MFYKQLNDGRVQCQLCNRSCVIPPDRTGKCRVRMNRDGRLYSLVYGRATSIAVDPVEKKPLFHFHPGHRVLSFGTVSCNFRCKHCQNYGISQVGPSEVTLKRLGDPKEIYQMTRDSGCRIVAWTYNEPLIWFEYVYDVSRYLKKKGIKTILITNGYAKEQPLRKIAPYLDAVNIDIKAFTDTNYMNMSNVHLQPVLDTLKLSRSLGLHIEISYLVVPGINDSRKEVSAMSRWVVDELGAETPIHFLRFHPHYKLADRPQTPLKALLDAYMTAQGEGLYNVYVGNVRTHGYENTRCPKCDHEVIKRDRHTLINSDLEGNRCPSCGAEILLVGRQNT